MSARRSLLSSSLAIAALLLAGCDGAAAGLDACASGCDDAGTPSPPDPCGDVPVTGRCASSSEVQYCSVVTGDTEASIVSVSCEADEVCEDSGEIAECRLTAECRESAVECLDATGGRWCQSGAWTAFRCPRDCIDTPFGGGCAPDIATRSVSLRVTYEARAPNPSLTDWSEPSERAAQGFVVLSLRGSEIVDATVTGGGASAGELTIRVPTAVSDEDRVAVYAVGFSSTGALAYAVAEPGYEPSDEPRDPHAPAPAPRVWGWVWEPASLRDGQTLRITEDRGGGPARVFDYLRYVFASTERFYDPTVVPTLIAWVGLETRWTCGSCFSPLPTRAFGVDFRSQMFGGGGSDRMYFSDAVSGHELGHYVMAAHGRGPREGGPHAWNRTTHPGQAWSEGWATFFGSDLLDASVFFNKQSGTFYWFDIEAGTSSSSATWPAPSAAGGLLQMISENAVAGMLWRLRGTLGREPLWAALADPRVRVPPFERGYTTRRWSDPRNPADYVDTGASAPMLADYLDALLCRGGATVAQVDAATEPATRYPYPSGSPLCR